MINKFAVIVAGGSGSRMKSALPKQFIELNGRPVLMHTIEVFYKFDPAIKIVLVLPSLQFDYWNELCEQFSFTMEHQLVAGGETRFHSVKNGLAQVENEGLVAIHDGVRPLVSLDTIARCFQAAAQYGNAIPCLPVYESVRKIENNANFMIDRSSLRSIQTPQVFSCALIKKAFNQLYDPCFTDDASVLERIGEKINLVEGNRENIKITDPYDLIIATAFCRG